jgi:hypothetical protein
MPAMPLPNVIPGGATSAWVEATAADSTNKKRWQTSTMTQVMPSDVDYI